MDARSLQWNTDDRETKGSLREGAVTVGDWGRGRAQGKIGFLLFLRLARPREGSSLSVSEGSRANSFVFHRYSGRLIASPTKTKPPLPLVGEDIILPKKEKNANVPRVSSFVFLPAEILRLRSRMTRRGDESGFPLFSITRFPCLARPRKGSSSK